MSDGTDPLPTDIAALQARLATALADRDAAIAERADVLTKLVNLWPASRLDELMPWAWASSNRVTAPEQVAA